MVTLVRQAEWTYGECGEVAGWFPGCYVLLGGGGAPSSTSPPPLPPLPEHLAHNDLSEFYVASYAYDVSRRLTSLALTVNNAVTAYY